MRTISKAAMAILTHIELFSQAVLGQRLRRYQAVPLRSIIKSVVERQGLEFLLIFPRQSGKNEAVAHLQVYLLNMLQRVGGNIVFAATGDGIGRGVQRMEARLDNRWNKDTWSKSSSPLRRTLGGAAVVFISSHPQASSRGETAHWLLIIDEFQEQDPSHIEAVFQPMRAANNATALYIGTVRHRSDALWLKRMELEREQAADGIQRVFIVPPEEVIRENPAYGSFLESRISKLGRDHPIVASEYFLEPLEDRGGLFPPRRRALMRGNYARKRDFLEASPQAARIACIDIGGQDEAATDPLARLSNPGRDYTVATLFEIHQRDPVQEQDPSSDASSNLPVYRAVDVFVDHGSRHFQDSPGRPSLVKRLLAWLRMWQVDHLIVDSAGVGEGIFDFLCAALGRSRVTGYDFQGRGKKAALGSSFLALVETGRFNYWSWEKETDESKGGTREKPLSDGWWFWLQVAGCTYELPPGGRFDRDLRWGVPPGASAGVAGASQPLHDDRLLSAALIALADDLRRAGVIRTGHARSAVIRPADPLNGLHF